jgi:hypothetical protein
MEAAMPGTSGTTYDLKSLSESYIKAVGRRDFDRVAELLHPEVVFSGPGKPLQGAGAYLGALRRLGPVLLRNDIRKVVADGNDVGVFYEFVTDTDVGAVPSAEWLTFEDGRIRSVHLVFHTQPWPKVLEELTRRANASASADAA